MVSIQHVSHQHADVNPLVFGNRTASLILASNSTEGVEKKHTHTEGKKTE